MAEEKIYSEKIHAKRLIAMLETRKDAKGSCPASEHFSPNMSPAHTFLLKPHPCDICNEFVNNGRIRDIRTCPCVDLGCEEAVKRSWLALEAKGYI